MNVLIDVIDKINSTQSAMRRIEDELSIAPDNISLQATYQTLFKRHQNLEEKFLDYSIQDSLDVCTFRLLSEVSGRYPILALGDALHTFQNWFSSIYDALKTGPKERARLSADTVSESSLNFAFSYPGSVGVVMTIPKERLIFKGNLESAMSISTDMLRSESSEHVHHFAQELGTASIRALNALVKSHVSSGLGVDIHWLRGSEPIAQVRAGYEHMINLQQAIKETSDIKELNITIPGMLVGADTVNHTFHFITNDEEDIRGKMSDSIGESYTVVLPKHYQAHIKKTSHVNYATNEEKISYFMESLD